MPQTHPNNSQPPSSGKFGGFQFTHELELCFESSADVLMQMLNSQINSLPHPVGLILGNVHHNAVAVLSLAPEKLVSEAYLVMRVLLDSAITAGCLLGVDENERHSYVHRNGIINHPPTKNVEDIINHARDLNFSEGFPSHYFRPLQERIDILCKHTGANPDSWRVLVASIFPHTSELLMGSVRAYAFRFRGDPSRANLDTDNDEFSMLFLMGTEILCDLVRFCSKCVEIDELYLKAKAIHERILAIMERRGSGIEDPMQGGWHRLDRLEHIASRNLSPQLAEFEEAFQFSYEAAVIAPTLRKVDDKSRFKHAALYFRRALNDLRAVWILLSNGYTAQASTCAGSLFESCLATICLLEDDNIQNFESKLRSVTGNDFPWGAMQMAKMACAKGFNLTAPNPKYENSWRSLYARYVWLSQIRHSTFQSVIHDAVSTKLDCGDYFIMAIPNCTEDDMPVKIGIAIGSLADLQDATNALLSAFGYDHQTGNPLFDDRKQKAEVRIDSLVGKFSLMKNPITIAKTKFMLRHPPVPGN